MKRQVLLIVALMLVAAGAVAQIPANVMDVLNKCDEKMSDPKGIILDMTLKTKILIMSVNGTVKMCEKGEKSYIQMTAKAMGKEMRVEHGFDGQQDWEFAAATSKKERDTLTITKTNKANKDDFSLDLDVDKMYKTAKMKEKGLYYEISLSDRIDPQAPKKMSLKIAKNNYNLREVVYSEGGAKITMTVTKIMHGCSDSWFKLDMNRYKNAVVVRK